jgi:L-ribulose-5-phosphate 3-epimerase
MGYSKHMQRRAFLALPGALAAQPAPRFRKGICSGIFPADMSFEEKFRRTREAGFEGIEMALGAEIPLDLSADELKRIADAARRAQVEIVSVWISGPLSDNPLNSPDPEKRARGVATVIRALDAAATLGCGAMLIVPGRVGSGAKMFAGYEDSWNRISAELKKVVPHAEKRKVIITPENVWNKFLVSPLEMRAFVDQFQSPWFQTQFDTGNIMQWGYPQDWILTLGPRIKRVHVKDYKLSSRSEQGRFVDLLEGDVDFKEVMAALVKVGYRGFISPEYGGDKDPDRINKMSRALDTILAMA